MSPGRQRRFHVPRGPAGPAAGRKQRWPAAVISGGRRTRSGLLRPAVGDDEPGQMVPDQGVRQEHFVSAAVLQGIYLFH